MPTTLDQTVAALATASQALQAAQSGFQTATGLWESALNEKGLLARHTGPRRKHPLPAPPANPDLNALAEAVVSAKATLQAAQTTYNTAKTAHDAAMAAAGVIPTVSTSS